MAFCVNYDDVKVEPVTKPVLYPYIDLLLPRLGNYGAHLQARSLQQHKKKKKEEAYIIAR